MAERRCMTGSLSSTIIKETQLRPIDAPHRRTAHWLLTCIA